MISKTKNVELSWSITSVTGNYLIITNPKDISDSWVGVYLDVTKAYDNVRLDILLDWVKNDAEIEWEAEEDKEETVKMIKIWSNTDIYLGGGVICKKTKGIPQGSAPAPMLFAYYQQRCLEQASLPQELYLYADNISFICKKDDVDFYIE